MAIFPCEAHNYWPGYQCPECKGANVTTPATTPADPIGWYEAEPNCAGADLRNLLQWPGQMLHSGQMHWQAERPNTTNPVWPLYSHPPASPATAEPEPQWLVDLRQELMMAKMTHNFTLSRDEVMYLLATPSPGKAQEPVAWQRRVMDGDRPLSGWIHCDEWDIETQRQYGNEVRALGLIATLAVPCKDCDGQRWIFRGNGEDTECEACIKDEGPDLASPGKAFGTGELTEEEWKTYAASEGLFGRIERALSRHLDGGCARRIPADVTDSDLVLEDFQRWRRGEPLGFWNDAAVALYASPGKAEAEDAARYRFLMSTAYGNLLPSTEALDAIMKPFSASIQQERD